jgi:hypothetical protein
MTKAVYDTDDDGKVDSAKTLDGFDSTDFASRTASDLTLYVYEDATGDADGSSKANGFTSLQAAIDAIPDVAQSVTIIVSKGSTNYLGDTTVIQKASVKSLTIRGEYYWYANCDANAVAGKIVDSDIDTTGMEVGDRVVCTHYSGTVGSSSIDDYFYATITEIGAGYVQTSEATKVPTTGWKYLINQTVFDGTGIANDSILKAYYTSLYISGIYVENGTSDCITSYMQSRISIYDCIIRNSRRVSASLNGELYVYRSAILSPTLGSAVALYYNSYLYFEQSVIDGNSGSASTIQLIYSGNANLNLCYIGKTVGVSSDLGSTAVLSSCYIASTCTYGAYGYNITLVSCTNNATTPVTNLTSGGSIEEWGGEPLPSIADATGGQVLALKSDKSALEFATVSGGGGITWTEVTGTTQAASADNGYITNNESLVTVTLPSTCAVGKTIRIIGKGAGGWKLAQNSGQSIRVGTDETTEGTSGYIESGSPYDSIEVVCVTEDTEFTVMQMTGVLGVV